ncbi:MAG TPA: 50S ribosomal protein L25, partial [Candidatus Kapabacteria bacterium]|nr:50S ribosomal protein L25 [Candidatus Kapabacteria bacterium]
NQSLKRLRIQCYPQNLPEALEIDITQLGQGEKIRIRDLSFENIALMNPSDSLVVGVKAKR